MKSIMETLGGEFERVVIRDLKDSTFFATLYVRHSGKMLEIDSRPSDAMALACRTDTPIFIEEHVLEAARMRLPEEVDEADGTTTPGEGDTAPKHAFVPLAIDSDAPVEELEEILKNLEPDDFGKYKM